MKNEGVPQQPSMPVQLWGRPPFQMAYAYESMQSDIPGLS